MSSVDELINNDQKQLSKNAKKKKKKKEKERAKKAVAQEGTDSPISSTSTDRGVSDEPQGFPAVSAALDESNSNSQSSALPDALLETDQIHPTDSQEFDQNTITEPQDNEEATEVPVTNTTADVIDESSPLEATEAVVKPDAEYIPDMITETEATQQISEESYIVEPTPKNSEHKSIQNSSHQEVGDLFQSNGSEDVEWLKSNQQEASSNIEAPPHHNVTQVEDLFGSSETTESLPWEPQHNAESDYFTQQITPNVEVASIPAQVLEESSFGVEEGTQTDDLVPSTDKHSDHNDEEELQSASIAGSAPDGAGPEIVAPAQETPEISSQANEYETIAPVQQTPESTNNLQQNTTESKITEEHGSPEDLFSGNGSTEPLPWEAQDSQKISSNIIESTIAVDSHEEQLSTAPTVAQSSTDSISEKLKSMDLDEEADDLFGGDSNGNGLPWEVNEPSIDVTTIIHEPDATIQSPQDGEKKKLALLDLELDDELLEEELLDDEPLLETTRQTSQQYVPTPAAQQPAQQLATQQQSFSQQQPIPPKNQSAEASVPHKHYNPYTAPAPQPAVQPHHLNIQKLNENKKKSDAYDFPEAFIPKATPTLTHRPSRVILSQPQPPQFGNPSVLSPPVPGLSHKTTRASSVNSGSFPSPVNVIAPPLNPYAQPPQPSGPPATTSRYSQPSQIPGPAASTSRYIQPSQPVGNNTMMPPPVVGQPRKVSGQYGPTLQSPAVYPNGAVVPDPNIAAQQFVRSPSVPAAAPPVNKGRYAPVAQTQAPPQTSPFVPIAGSNGYPQQTIVPGLSPLIQQATSNYNKIAPPQISQGSQPPAQGLSLSVPVATEQQKLSPSTPSVAKYAPINHRRQASATANQYDPYSITKVQQNMALPIGSQPQQYQASAQHQQVHAQAPQPLSQQTFQQPYPQPQPLTQQTLQQPYGQPQRQVQPPLPQLPQQQLYPPQSVSQQPRQQFHQPPAKSFQEPLRDPESLRNRDYPLLSWGNGKKIAYFVPSSHPHYSTVRNIHIVDTEKVLADPFLKEFPLPSKKNTSAISKFLEKRIDFLSTNIASEVDADELLLAQLLSHKLNNVEGLFNLNGVIPYNDQQQLTKKITLNKNTVPLNKRHLVSLISSGQKEQAVNLALVHEDFSLALLISSVIDKDAWLKIVDKYLGEEFSGDHNHFLSTLFTILTGDVKKVIDGFRSDQIRKAWAITNWRGLATAVVLNNPPSLVSFLAEFGSFLVENGKHLPAYILYILGDVSIAKLEELKSAKFTVYAEIYGLSLQNRGIPVDMTSILLEHTSYLIDYQMLPEAQKYLDLAGYDLKNSKVASARTKAAFKFLSDQLAGSAMESWFGRPKLGNVWGHLDKSLNKFISGDEIKEEKPEGVFSKFSPSVSRNTSYVSIPTAIANQSYSLDNARAPPTGPRHSSPYAPASLHPPYDQTAQGPPPPQDSVSANSSFITNHPPSNFAPPPRVAGGQSPKPKTSRYGINQTSRRSSTHSLTGSLDHNPPSALSNIRPASANSSFTAPANLVSRSPSVPQSPPTLNQQRREKSARSSFAEVSQPVFSSQNDTPPQRDSYFDHEILNEIVETPSESTLEKHHAAELVSEVEDPATLVRGDDIENGFQQYDTEEQSAVFDDEEGNEESVPESSIENTPAAGLNRTVSDFGSSFATTYHVPPDHHEEHDIPQQLQNRVLESTSPESVIKRSPVREVANPYAPAQISRPLQTSSPYPTNGSEAVRAPPQRSASASRFTPKSYLPSGDQAPLQDAPLRYAAKPESAVANGYPSSESKAPSGGLQAEAVIKPAPRVNDYQSVPELHGTSVLGHTSPTVESPPRNGSVTSSVNLHAPVAVPAPAPGAPRHVPSSNTYAPQTASPVESRFNPYQPSSSGESQSIGGSLSSLPSTVTPRTSNFDSYKPPVVSRPSSAEGVVASVRWSGYEQATPVHSIADIPEEDEYYDDVVEESDDDDDEDSPKSKTKEADKKEKPKSEESSGKDSKGTWLGWFGTKEKKNDTKVYKAKLGEKSNFYYDEELKRWVNRSDNIEDLKAEAAPPPPPTVRKKPSNLSKPRSGSTSIDTRPPTVPQSSSEVGAVPSPSGAPTGGPPPRASLPAKSDLDSLLTFGASTGNSTGRRRKRPGYVNVLQQSQDLLNQK